MADAQPNHLTADPHIERDRAYSTLAPEQTKATRKQADRLLDRVAPFHQSKGHLNIYRRVPARLYFRLYTADWFHSVLNTKTNRILIGLVASYFTLYVVFAIGYFLADDECLPDISSHQFVDGSNHTLTGSRRFVKALYFSMETIMTIGFASKDPAYGGCFSMWLLITLQALSGVFAQSVLFGFVFARLSRADKRVYTVTFSSQAVVRDAGGALWFVMRMCEMRKKQLLSTKLRCYAVTTGSDGGVECLPMRIESPNDGTPFTALPSLIAHRIDATSPLAPRPDDDAAAAPAVPEAPLCEVKLLRALNDPSPAAAVIAASAALDGGSTAAAAASAPTASSDALMEQWTRAVRTHIELRNVEVLVLLEGNDSTSSSVCQARHSYTPADIAWDSIFTPCMHRTSDGGVCINFEDLHRVRPLGRFSSIRVEAARASSKGGSDLEAASGIAPLRVAHES